MPAADPYLILGIDPGGRHMGVVLQTADNLLSHLVVEVAKGKEPLTRRHLRDAVAAAESLVLDLVGGEARQLVVAVESVVQPGGFRNGRRDPINMHHLIGTATLYGALLQHTWPGDAVVVSVPPNHHGSGALASYPAALVTDAERRKGLNRPAGQSALIRHARSAWDVSKRAPAFVRAARLAA
jgi:hypothetical protein